MAVLTYDPNVLLTEYDRQVEEKILKTVSKNNPISPDKLLSELKKAASPRYNAYAFKEIIWRMLDENKIVLTDDQQIRLPN